jgi:hypothetical protein
MMDLPSRETSVSVSVLGLLIMLAIPAIVVVAVIVVVRSSQRGDRTPEYWKPPEHEGPPSGDEGAPPAP